MNPRQFIGKWHGVDLSERAAAQSHFNYLYALLRQLNPISADPKGEWFTLEKGTRKASEVAHCRRIGHTAATANLVALKQLLPVHD